MKHKTDIKHSSDTKQSSDIRQKMQLSVFLAKAQLKIRNEGSFLGFFWYILNPLALFLTILFIKQSAFLNIDIEYYPLYLLIGLSTLSLVSRVIFISAEIIKGNGTFIKAMKFPIESLVYSSLLHLLFLYVFEVFLIFCLALFYGIPFLNFVLFSIYLLVFTASLIGISFIITTIGVYISDITNVWNIVSQILLFITPIFYVLKPGTELATFNYFNPLYYFITLARDSLMYGRVDGFIFMISCGLTATSLVVGIIVFERNKKKFAELV